VEPFQVIGQLSSYQLTDYMLVFVVRVFCVCRVH